MALSAGIQVAQSDLVVKGGIKNIFITEYSGCTFSAPTAGGLDWTADNQADDKIFNFEFELETANWTWQSTSERGSTIVEHTCTFYVPNMGKAKLQELQQIANIPVLVLIRLQSGTDWVIGHSASYKSLNGVANDQMFAMVSSIEGNSGTAFADTQGVTVTITARQGEYPYESLADISNAMASNAIVVQ